VTPYRCADCGRVGTRRFVPIGTSADDGFRCTNRRACEHRQIRHGLHSTA